MPCLYDLRAERRNQKWPYQDVMFGGGGFAHQAAAFDICITPNWRAFFSAAQFSPIL
jgi:hypothetical protein